MSQKDQDKCYYYFTRWSLWATVSPVALHVPKAASSIDSSSAAESLWGVDLAKSILLAVSRLTPLTWELLWLLGSLWWSLWISRPVNMKNLLLCGLCSVFVLFIRLWCTVLYDGRLLWVLWSTFYYHPPGSEPISDSSTALETVLFFFLNKTHLFSLHFQWLLNGSCLPLYICAISECGKGQFPLSLSNQKAEKTLKTTTSVPVLTSTRCILLSGH